MIGIDRLLEAFDRLDDRIGKRLDGLDERLRCVEGDCKVLVERSEAAESLEGRVRAVEQANAKAKGERRSQWKLIAAIAAAVGGGGAGLVEGVKAIAGAEDTAE